jgi:hypothetical protein
LLLVVHLLLALLLCLLLLLAPLVDQVGDLAW